MNHIKKISLSFIAATALTLFLLNSIGPLSVNTQAAFFNETEWRLEISGLVDNPLNLTLDEIAAMPATNVQATIYCVDFPTQIVTTGNWTGVKLEFLLAEADISPSAAKIALFASDGYSTDLTLEAAMQPDVIVAYEKDGVPLGETLRLVVPGRWGYKWISQLTKIEVVNYDFKGKWESLGHSDDGITASGGRSSIPANPTGSSPPTGQQNATTTPATTPNPSNSSSNLPSQETQDPLETTEPQNPEPFPTSLIVIASSASIAIATAIMLFRLRKARNRTTELPN